MQFYLKHTVGNRERWKTRGTLSHASGVIIAEELTKVPGVTGLEFLFYFNNGDFHKINACKF